MELFDVSFAGAFIAGILSFVSPCVLPLVPAYLCYLGGVSMDRLTGEGKDEGEDEDEGEDWLDLAGRVFPAALGFVAGFSTVFIILGATASVLGQMLLANMAWLGKVAGVVIILFGLHFAGVFRLRFLQLEHRFEARQASSSPLGGYVMGLAFAFGWTPCVGPVLATILMMAANEHSLARGVTLLGAYALGIGLPFLLAALATGPFLALMGRFRRHIRWVEIITGALLVMTGILILTGSLTAIGSWLLRNVPLLGGWG